MFYKVSMDTNCQIESFESFVYDAIYQDDQVYSDISLVSESDIDAYMKKY